MRGKLGFLGIHSPSRGLIPARAGKTPRHAHAPVGAQAHPRACGENSASTFELKSLFGSSPRVRGKLSEWETRPYEDGLIPARAGKTHRRSRRTRSSWAHPRACGENGGVGGVGHGGSGSSPRVRGKPSKTNPGVHTPRLIPARAGKTVLVVTSAPWWRAHPRACGENGWARRHIRAQPGSSPRVRGKLDERREGTPLRGLIPARAGKTRPARGSGASRWAHPRACGENPAAPLSLGTAPGSSPRVRGKRRHRRRDEGRPGLIPARAGKTIRLDPPGLDKGAHPRACGENLVTIHKGVLADGSSPRVRGKPDLAHGGLVHDRLIPARAGKTSSTTPIRSCSWAHPRACGENLVCGHGASAPRGSSPRVRGKLGGPVGFGDGGGLIPARAGKTRGGIRCRWSGWAHPRACGENALRRTGATAQDGSSPRVRGKPGDGPAAGARPGLIPARAGKTAHPRQSDSTQQAHPRACGEN